MMEKAFTEYLFSQRTVTTPTIGGAVANRLGAMVLTFVAFGDAQLTFSIEGSIDQSNWFAIQLMRANFAAGAVVTSIAYTGAPIITAGRMQTTINTAAHYFPFYRVNITAVAAAGSFCVEWAGC